MKEVPRVINPVKDFPIAIKKNHAKSHTSLLRTARERSVVHIRPQAALVRA